MKGLFFGIVVAFSCAAAAVAAEDPGVWKGDLTGVWQCPCTPDLTRGKGVVMANAPDPIEIAQAPTRAVILYESWRIFRSIPTVGIEVTADDASAYTRPWKHSRVFRLQPGIEMMECVCLENEKDRSHLPGIK